MEPATNRIKRLLEILSSYSFNLYYIKGKDMILSDFLSRQIEDDSNPHEIIPISFNIQEILQENYHQLTTDTYNVQTRAQAKAQANTPTMPNAQPRSRKLLPRLPHCQYKLKKKKQNLRQHSVELPNRPQEALCYPQILCYPQLLCLQMIGHHPSLQTLMKLIQIHIKDQIQEWI